MTTERELDDEGLALLREARDACCRWHAGGASMSIPVRQSDGDVLLSAIDAYLAKPRQAQRDEGEAGNEHLHS